MIYFVFLNFYKFVNVIRIAVAGAFLMGPVGGMVGGMYKVQTKVNCSFIFLGRNLIDPHSRAIFRYCWKYSRISNFGSI